MIRGMRTVGSLGFCQWRLRADFRLRLLFCSLSYSLLFRGKILGNEVLVAPVTFAARAACRLARRAALYLSRLARSREALVEPRHAVRVKPNPTRLGFRHTENLSALSAV